MTNSFFLKKKLLEFIRSFIIQFLQMEKKKKINPNNTTGTSTFTM